MREIRPSIEDLDELNLFKCIGIPKPLIDLTALKTELPVYLALAQDINDQDFDKNCILPFFKTHRKELPNWGQFASLLAAQQISSAAVERVFSILKQAFDETQESSLNDYVMGIVMKMYNNRNKKN